MSINKFKKAFSLIELSIVVLVIGILIAGMTQGSSAVKKFRLYSARTLTQSSPVNGIKNLVAWYEATSEKSFDYTIDANSSTINKVANWYDINPQLITKKNAYQNTSENQPTYVEDIINGLPVVRFTFSDSQYLNLPDGTVPYNNSPYTIFFVSKTNALAQHGILGSGNYSDPNKSNAFRYDSIGLYNYWWDFDLDSTGNPITIGEFYVIDYYYNLSIRELYINGSLNNSMVSSSNEAVESNNTIGRTSPTTYGGEYMNGDIAEIIIFDRALKDEERKSVEKYLGKKWAISVS